jgi:hypothetical protein
MTEVHRREFPHTRETFLGAGDASSDRDSLDTVVARSARDVDFVSAKVPSWDRRGRRVCAGVDGLGQRHPWLPFREMRQTEARAVVLARPAARRRGPSMPGDAWT